MSEKQTPRPPVLIFNPAYRPGVDPLRTPLRKDSTRGILWDQPVKLVPEPTATDLVQYGGCSRCLTVEAAADYFGLEIERVEALLRSPKVTTQTYQPHLAFDAPDAPEPVTVIVLDVETRRRIRKETATHKGES